MNYVYYFSNGRIDTVYSCTPDLFKLQDKPENLNLIETDLDVNPSSYYVDGKNIVEIPESPHEYALFDYETKQWVNNEALALYKIRQERDRLLLASDWTDTLSAKTRLGDTLYQQWQDYRQQLRDITQQDVFNLTWPTAPDKP